MRAPLQYSIAHACLRFRLSFLPAFPFVVRGTLLPDFMATVLSIWIFIGLLFSSAVAAQRSFFPAAIPLAVRSPHFSVWYQNTAGGQPLPNSWPFFWNGVSRLTSLSSFARATTMGHSLSLAGQAGLEWTKSRTRGWATMESGTAPQLSSIFKSPRRDPSSSCRQVR